MRLLIYSHYFPQVSLNGRGTTRKCWIYFPKLSRVWLNYVYVSYFFIYASIFYNKSVPWDRKINTYMKYMEEVIQIRLY